MTKENVYAKVIEIAKYSENVSYRAIARFLLQDISAIKRLSIYELAKKTATSAATVTRFCKQIGLDGYKGLYVSLILSTEFKKQAQILQGKNLPIEKDNLLDDLLNVTIQSITKTVTHSRNQILLAVEILKAKTGVALFGAGGNIYLNSLFRDWLFRINKKTLFSSDFDEQIAYANAIDESDCAVIVSFSLQSPKFANILKVLDSKNIQKIIITKNITSELIAKNDVVIEIGENESVINNRQNSETTTLFILKTIFYTLISEENLDQFLKTDV